MFVSLNLNPFKVLLCFNEIHFASVCNVVTQKTPMLEKLKRKDVIKSLFLFVLQPSSRYSDFRIVKYSKKRFTF